MPFLNNSQSVAIVDGVEKSLADLPLDQRSSAQPGAACWRLSPIPTVMHWGDTYRFTLCCDDSSRIPDGSWYFYGINPDGVLDVLKKEPIAGKPGDPCTTFQVTVPNGADTFTVNAECTDFFTRCKHLITIVCQQREL